MINPLQYHQSNGVGETYAVNHIYNSISQDYDAFAPLRISDISFTLKANPVNSNTAVLVSIDNADYNTKTIEVLRLTGV